MIAETSTEDMILLELEFEAKPPCFWAVPHQCVDEATWMIAWSCGCVSIYCDQHIDTAWALIVVHCEDCETHATRVRRERL